MAGEASGDGHGADVVRAMKRARADLTFFGMGGPKLAAEGLELIHGAHEISVMGIAEVLPKIPRILKVLGDLERAATERRPGWPSSGLMSGSASGRGVSSGVGVCLPLSASALPLSMSSVVTMLSVSATAWRRRTR